jgi:hypothetical protein
MYGRAGDVYKTDYRAAARLEDFPWYRLLFTTISSVLNYRSFDFLASSLAAHFIKKSCAHIIKFKLFLKDFY